MTAQENWKRWYNDLSRREKMHYHYNRSMFFDDGWFESIDRRLGYPKWMESVEDFLERTGCLLFGHAIMNLA